MMRLSSMALAAIAAGALLFGCGPSGGEPCLPGSPGCTAVMGTALAGDPRFVGPGMRGSALPHWPMFHHDATHTGLNGVAAPASGFVSWVGLTGGQIWSSPAIGLDGTVYVGSLDGKLYAFSREGCRRGRSKRCRTRSRRPRSPATGRLVFDGTSTP
ncbi:MAG: PQQ-binding-like beta-propeller repeat protein [Polyangiaceae bacterium]